MDAALLARGNDRLMKRVFQRTVVACSASLLVSCTVLQPVPPLPRQAFFYPPAKAPATAASMPGAGAETCKNARTEWQNNPGCFYNGLGITMEAIERDRERRLDRAASSLNTTALYNVALPLGGAAVLYRRLTGGHGLLGPAALAAGVYGAMTSGAPEAYKHELRIARELQCTSMRHAHWLYRSDEIEGRAEPDIVISHDTRNVIEKEGLASRSRQRWSFPSVARRADTRRVTDPPLQQLVDDMNSALRDYVIARSAMVGSLQAPAPSRAADAFDRARGNSGSGAKSDARGRIRQVTLQRQELAVAMRDRLELLKREIHDANWQLTAEWGAVGTDGIDKLGQALPAAQTPESVKEAIGKRISALAQGGDGTTVADVDPALDEDLVDGVKSATLLRQFNEHEGVELFLAWQAARRFVLRHEERERRMLEHLQAMQCHDRVPVKPTPVPRPALAASAARTTGTSRIEPL